MAQGQNTTGEDESAAHPRAVRHPGLLDDDAAAVASIARAWEVRRYCQLKPSLAQYDRHTRHREARDDGEDGFHTPLVQSSSSKPEDAHLQADPALNALLRSLLYELDADLAMLSLLDHEHQHFMAGASRSDLSTADVTIEATKWFGCDFVTHHGGLCERTITLKELPAVYEELDLASNPRTKDLPFVSGEIASFRNYVGSPVRTRDGIVIGTVFAFSNTPSSGISGAKRSFLTNTADHVMMQLSQALDALQSKRSVKFNKAVATLLESKMPQDALCGRASRTQGHQLNATQSRQSPLVLSIYEQAAELLCSAFELDGMQFQEVGVSHSEECPTNGAETMLARWMAPDVVQPAYFTGETTQQLLEHYPMGGVFHLLSKADGGSFSGASREVSASHEGAKRIVSEISLGFRQSIPEAQQIIFMPMWNTYRGANVAIAVGWAVDFDRVYSGKADLAPLSALCMSIMTQARRVETQAEQKIKNDFLGSISHEMRSPLHANLACLELLLSTNVTPQQLDLLRNASISGNQLLDTINKILQFTNISSPALESDNLEDPVTPTRNRSHFIHPSGNDQIPAAPAEDVGLLDLCEKVVQDTVQKLQSTGAMKSPTSKDTKISDPEVHPVVITFDSMPDNVRIANYQGFGTVFANLFANALKYSGIDCCLRAHLSVDTERVTVVLSDCGRGMSKDFLQNHLYVPFSQADPVDAGTGLGLPLVKRTVDSLGGSIRIQSDEATGTTVKVVISLESLAGWWESPDQAEERVKSRFPVPLRAQVFVPPVWASGQYGMKGQRLIDNLFTSLERNLNGHTETHLSVLDTSHERSDLVVVRNDDRPAFEEKYGEKFAAARKLFFGAEASLDKPTLSMCEQNGVGRAPAIELIGPLLPSKLWEALDRLFEDTESTQLQNDETPPQYSEPQAVADKQAASEAQENGEDTTVSQRSVANGDGNEHPREDSGTTLLDRTRTAEASVPPPGAPAQPPIDKKRPHLLLVDDNAINLKILRMFVDKCGVGNDDFLAVGGGQEAIDAFKNSITGATKPDQEDGDESLSSDFDIILMDLSMPEVDGFQATSEIRRIETESHLQQRSTIVALTGLVSSKDRDAAMAAGVDGYITKPAKIKNIQDIIDRWKASNSASDDT